MASDGEIIGKLYLDRSNYRVRCETGNVPRAWAPARPPGYTIGLTEGAGERSKALLPRCQGEEVYLAGWYYAASERRGMRGDGVRDEERLWEGRERDG